MRSRALLAAATFLLGCGQSAHRREPVLVAAGGINHFPFAFDLPGGGVLVGYSTHKDEVVANPVDSARLLGSAAPVSAQNFYLSGVAPVTTGLYGASYITTALDERSERVHGWASSDNGSTWTPRPGILRLPEPQIDRAAGWGGLLFHRRLHRMGGKVGGTLYGGYARDRKPGGMEWYRSVWAESEDDGASWHVRSVIAEGEAGTEGFGEPVSAICPDRRILVVMRTGGGSPMQWARSADDGTSWSAPRVLPEVVGYDPDLLALPGAGLLLSWGVPGAVRVAASQDCGDSWHPIAEFDIATCSGYSGMAVVNGGLTIFTDRNNETEVWGYPVPGGFK